MDVSHKMQTSPTARFGEGVLGVQEMASDDSARREEFVADAANERFNFSMHRDETMRSAKHLSNDCKKMFYERNRIRADGVIVSRNTYVKACPRREIGVKKEHRPARVVVYYKCFQFLENEWYSKTSPEQ